MSTTSVYVSSSQSAPAQNNATPTPAAAQSQATIAQLQAELAALENNLNSFFLLINGIIIFIMNMGFTFLEGGMARSKHCVHTLLINFIDPALTCITFWLVGFAFAFGGNNPFIGTNYFACSNIPADSNLWSFWFFEYTFASAAASIVSGSVIERLEFLPFSVYSIFIILVYSIGAHWVWDPVGWLAAGFTVNGEQITYHDFAGSSVVHICGGSAAFVAAIITGPRVGKRDPLTGKDRDLPHHNLPMSTIGAFILLFGFLAFNGGSQGHISQVGDGANSALAVTNTIIAGSSAAITSLLLSRVGYFSNKRWSMGKCMNGALVGMVAICSGCGSIWPYGAFCTGVIAAFSYMTWSRAVKAMGIDDPLEAVAVHLGGGSWGVIATAFFHRTSGILYGGSGYLLAWQICGGICIALWSGLLTAVYFTVCKALKILRAAPIEEERGLDWPTCGEVAYPFHSGSDGWVVGADAYGAFVIASKDAHAMNGIRNSNFTSSVESVTPHSRAVIDNPRYEGLVHRSTNYDGEVTQQKQHDDSALNSTGF